MEKRDRTALPLTPEGKALEDSFKKVGSNITTSQKKFMLAVADMNIGLEDSFKKVGSLAYDVLEEHWLIKYLRERDGEA